MFCVQLRLEALHQIVVLISGMEEKGSQLNNADRSSTVFQSSSLLTSVRLQFLAGCFGLGTVGTGVLKRENVQLHHYQVWLSSQDEEYLELRVSGQFVRMIGIICYLIDLHLNVFTGYLAC